MNPEELLTNILLFQWGALFVVGIVYAFVSQWIFRKRRKREQGKTELIQWLEFVLRKEKMFIIKNLPRKYIRVSCMLPCIEQMDKIYMDQIRWRNLRSILIEEFLLLKARKMAYSHEYTQRMWAIRIFLLSPKQIDEEYIKILLRDTVSIIRHEAVMGAIRIGTKALVDQMIDAMSQEAYYARFAYRDALSPAGEIIFHFIKERLTQEKDDGKRVCCWHLLAMREDPEIVSSVGQDHRSLNKELRIAVARALGFCAQPEAVLMLLDLLKDGQWEVRAVAAKSLGRLKVTQSITQLNEALKDQQWWVRINSAYALNNMGEEGKAVLKQQSAGIDRYAFDAANFVLSHGEIKGV